MCDLVEVLEITQSKASRHLRYLLHAGLVEDRRDTLWVHYRIRERPDDEARQVIGAVGPLLEAQPLDELEQRLEGWIADKKRKGAGCSPAVGRKDQATAESRRDARRGKTTPAGPGSKRRRSTGKGATR